MWGNWIAATLDTWTFVLSWGVLAFIVFGLFWFVRGFLNMFRTETVLVDNSNLPILDAVICEEDEMESFLRSSG